MQSLCTDTMDDRMYDTSNREILEFVTKALQKCGGHGLDHTLRVVNLCQIIGTTEGANLDILIPAALLHDVARPLEEESGFPHEEMGAKIAEDLLTNNGFNPEYIPGVIHAIRSHRFRSDNTPETLEARILSDADKLDAIGAVGIARTFMTAGERKGDIQDGIDHINDKLLKLADRMYTGQARIIAQNRHAFLKNFVKIISDEMI